LITRNVKSTVVLLPVAVNFWIDILNVVRHLNPLKIRKIKILILRVENDLDFIVVLPTGECFSIGGE